MAEDRRIDVDPAAVIAVVAGSAALLLILDVRGVGKSLRAAFIGGASGAVADQRRVNTNVIRMTERDCPTSPPREGR